MSIYHPPVVFRYFLFRFMILAFPFISCPLDLRGFEIQTKQEKDRLEQPYKIDAEALKKEIATEEKDWLQGEQFIGSYLGSMRVGKNKEAKQQLMRMFRAQGNLRTFSGYTEDTFPERNKLFREMVFESLERLRNGNVGDGMSLVSQRYHVDRL